jgi:hypothetical protein
LQERGASAPRFVFAETGRVKEKGEGGRAKEEGALHLKSEYPLIMEG